MLFKHERHILRQASFNWIDFFIFSCHFLLLLHYSSDELFYFLLHHIYAVWQLELLDLSHICSTLYYGCCIPRVWQCVEASLQHSLKTNAAFNTLVDCLISHLVRPLGFLASQGQMLWKVTTYPYIIDIPKWPLCKWQLILW